MTRSLSLLLAATLAFGGCRDGDAHIRRTEGLSSPAPPPRPVVDSIQPIDEEIRRFAASVGARPTALAGGAASRDELVASFVLALERADTAALLRMALDPAEFIHLYFPHTVYTSPPYEMDPAFIWFQMENQTSVGLARALRRYGGRPLGYAGQGCGREIVEGPNRVWDRCAVTLRVGEETSAVRLFGMILEREGAFKFVTYGNEL